MPLPRLWNVIEGFNRMQDMASGKSDGQVTPEQESASFTMASSFGKKTSFDCLPSPFQHYLKSMKPKAQSEGRNG
jgi:hypothetical protein